MLACVDGSGPGDKKEYARTMARSFVKEIVDSSPEPGAKKCYLQGPNALSMKVEFGWMVRVTYSQVSVLASDVVAFVRANWHPGERVFLAGYSRGGAAVIEAARRLKSQLPKLRIDAMFLFDAVERDLATFAGTIPSNVAHAYHAVNDRSTLSRWYFYNLGVFRDCGSRIEPPGQLETATFYATHAGMGGLPWTGDHPMRPDPGFGPHGPIGPGPVYVPTITREQDETGSRAVRQWMWTRLNKHGVFTRAAR